MPIKLNTLTDTADFAARLAPLLKAGDVIALQGDLGAGKTTLAKYLIRQLAGSATEVTSPTFNLVQLYDTDAFTIWHFDLYRLKSPHELVEIGLDEALSGGVSIIEWPEIAAHILPDEKLTLNLSCGEDDTRLLRIEGSGKWEKELPI